MKTFVLTCFLVVSATAAFVPSAQRQRRDVSELAPAYNYLPPNEKLALPELEIATEAIVVEEPTAAPPSAALGDKGYEYRTMRRLKYRYRTRRDVSHLAQQYLPPTAKYLPPIVPEEPEEEVVDTEELNAPVPKVANEYLPPAEEAVSTEAPVTEAPVAEVREAVPEEEVPQDTAVLANDGYHYKQPVEPEEEIMPVEDVAVPEVKSAANSEYLPPLEGDVVEAEGPEESAVLADDGYHYRTIKRLRF